MKIPLFIFYTIFSYALLFADQSFDYHKKHSEKIEQKVVYIDKMHSYDLHDENTHSKENKVLPKYLKNGWVIIKMTGSNGGGAYVLLEREKQNWDKQNIATAKPQKAQKVEQHRISVSRYNDIKVNSEKTSLHQIVQSLKTFNADKNSKLVLTIDKQASYKVVVKLMEELKAAGYTNISFLSE
jgi:hypothetical protein